LHVVLVPAHHDVLHLHLQGLQDARHGLLDVRLAQVVNAPTATAHVQDIAIFEHNGFVGVLNYSAGVGGNPALEALLGQVLKRFELSDTRENEGGRSSKSAAAVSPVCCFCCDACPSPNIKGEPRLQATSWPG
jgi:hypothetical protein